jgi:hypothetical protein
MSSSNKTGRPRVADIERFCLIETDDVDDQAVYAVNFHGSIVSVAMWGTLPQTLALRHFNAASAYTCEPAAGPS